MAAKRIGMQGLEMVHVHPILIEQLPGHLLERMGTAAVKTIPTQATYDGDKIAN